MAIYRDCIDSQMISEIFGLGSEIYSSSITFLQDQSNQESLYGKYFLEWREIFTKIYGYEIRSELFLKQTYFTQILKVIIISKLFSPDNLNCEEAYKEYTKKSLQNIFEFDYFFWTRFNKQLFRKIYNRIHNVKFAKQDLFSKIYQEIFISDVRHKIGEFFTPSILAEKMIDEVYKLGLKILDPSCGTGNFLVNIIINILNSSESDTIKSKAIENVFGFDINPLAIITARINIFLLLIEHFNIENYKLSNFNNYLIDSLFPKVYEGTSNIDIDKMYHSFDIVIGNPPWLTYKDLHQKDYQKKIRELSEILEIKPPSQYITHIELAMVFFYSIPSQFLKKKGTIFFVMPKSVITGDHCYKFRTFSLFSKNIEIWDFPNNYFFNINHICLKAEFIGKDNNREIQKKYPIKTKLFTDSLELKEETFYSSIRLGNDGAKRLVPKEDLEIINKLGTSPYKKKFFQGATLVPRTLVFFNKKQKKNDYLVVSSDQDILTRAKKQWQFNFKDKEIEQKFQFKTFLNIDLIPFLIKRKRNVFLPINDQLDFDMDFLERYPKALKFYEEMNDFYIKNKKRTSKIDTLFDNLNYWNKLKKQINNKLFIVVYNASGSNLKAAVINNERKKIIIGSENYYFSTNEESEANYLSAILNAPILSKNIKLVKSSRHIHKRPFMFPIPPYDNNNELHKELAKKGKNYQTIVQDLFFNNPNINSKKVRIIISKKLLKLEKLAKQVIFD
ncbi:MAG: class I SAM-dependent DNA methyltransferase [Candidatus Hermodarchaeota archaeon]